MKFKNFLMLIDELSEIIDECSHGKDKDKVKSLKFLRGWLLVKARKNIEKHNIKGGK